MTSEPRSRRPSRGGAKPKATSSGETTAPPPAKPRAAATDASASKPAAARKKQPVKAAPEEAGQKTTGTRRAAASRQARARRVSGEERLRLVAEAAYLRAERRNFAPGSEADDWYQAEVEVDARLASLGIAVDE